MATRISLNIALLATAVSIAACANVISTPAPIPAQAAADTIASGRPGARCDNAPVTTIDAYKTGVARHILRSNLGYTFDGHLPPMLPAIVVLRLSVDNTGTLTGVVVQRSRDEAASAAAVASVRRSGTFPLPCGLIVLPDGTLNFSETFLFNRNYQFQLRSLADPQ